ncbi:hypothetical protein GCM10009565_59570 [Amycolatopsis albidoflavus]
MRPPGERERESGDGGRDDGGDQQDDDHSLAECVLGLGRDLRRFRVEAASAGPVAAAFAARRGGTFRARGLRERLRLGFGLLVQVSVEFRLEFGEIILHRRIRIVGHGVVLLSLVASTAPSHYPGGQRGGWRPRDLLAFASHHGHENDEPCRGERDDDHRTGHLPSPPPILCCSHASHNSHTGGADSPGSITKMHHRIR